MGNDQAPQEEKQKRGMMQLTLNKTCFLPCDKITGTVKMTSIDCNLYRTLEDPSIHYTLQQITRHNLLVQEKECAEKTEANETLTICDRVESNEDYANCELTPFIEVPFEIKLPDNVLPTTVFNKDEYIYHLLTAESPYLGVSESVVVVIKPTSQFRKLNLYKKPCVCSFAQEKKMWFINGGKMKVSLKLESNSFPITKEVNSEIFIDGSDLKMNLKGFNLELWRTLSRHEQYDRSIVLSEEKEIVLRKEVKFDNLNKLKSYRIDDKFKFPTIELDDYNHLDLQKITKLKAPEKRFLPSTLGGLIQVKYFLRLTINVDSIFSGDEVLEVPIEFYWDEASTRATTPKSLKASKASARASEKQNPASYEKSKFSKASYDDQYNFKYY